MVGVLRFEAAVQEIFAVPVLPGRRFPDLINDDEKLLENSFVVPDAALADVPPMLRPSASLTACCSPQRGPGWGKGGKGASGGNALRRRRVHRAAGLCDLRGERGALALCLLSAVVHVGRAGASATGTGG